MDTRSAFAFALVALGIAGLWALIVGWISIQNGQLIIGQPAASSGSSGSSSSSTAPVAGAGGSPITYSGGGGWGEVNPGAPVLSGNPSSIGNVVGAVNSGTDLSQIYSPSSLLLSPIAGDGVSVNPYGVVAA